MRAVEDLLEKRDPVRKAKRAMQRQQTTKESAVEPSVKKVAGRSDNSHIPPQVIFPTAPAHKLDGQSLTNTRYAELPSAQKEVVDKHTKGASQKNSPAKTSLKKGAFSGKPIPTVIANAQPVAIFH